MNLKQIMIKNNLSKAELAEKMECSVDSAHSYLYRKGTKIPEYRLKLLKLNLEKEKS